jgi:HemY protein
MAEIESAERGDHGKAREWTGRAVRARRDPARVADGYVSERWLPISPLSGKLDAFVWAVPPEAHGGPVLEQVAQQALAEASAAEKPAVVITAAQIAPPAPPEASAPSKPAQSRKAGPVIAEPPLPDDPGPEPEAEAAEETPRFKLF